MISVRSIYKRRDIKRFVDFANDLYRDNPNYCPPLYRDELASFDAKRNPSLEHCEIQLFLAFRDNRIVGRIAAIINHKANEFWNYNRVRFAWMDFIDDFEVSKALLDAVVEWGRNKGMNQLNGPVGFSNWDHQGLLIEGFQYLTPLASLYNFPYYEKHLVNYGLQKEKDWIEYRITPPAEIPDRLMRMARIAEQRSHVHVDKVKNAKELVRKYGSSFMDVLDQAYQKLYNFQPLTPKQKAYYRDMYFPILNFDFVTVIVNDKQEIVGVGLGMPDISEPCRKCGGKLFPFGWMGVIKALRAKKMEKFDLLLVAVRPDYQGTGINSLFFVDQIPYFNQYGIKQVETTAILESNSKSLSQWIYFDKIQHKRRRAFILDL